jgi:hypothetical protein
MARLALKSEVAIMRAIGELVVPSVDYSVELDTLAGNRNEPWDYSIPLEDDVSPLQCHADPLEKEKYCIPRPQPN